MVNKYGNDIPWREITDESIFRNRRTFLKTLSAAAGAGAIGSLLPTSALAARAGKYDTTEAKTPEKDVTSWNNYYEFGTEKDDPAKNIGGFKTSPWTVQVDGVKKPAKYSIEDLLKGVVMEDRVYRMRCVEAWSMVIPWHGFPLADLIKRLEPAGNPKYVEFRALYAPDRMPGQKGFGGGLQWPYIEALRMDEAMNPLTMLAVGVYGHPGPAQNGAPLRLVTPWKYGFKGIKAITAIRFVEQQPRNSWNIAWPQAYGFYANVNPEVGHPNWSQATERRLGGGLLNSITRKNTLMFNGYTDYVASMYSGMDLKKNY